MTNLILAMVGTFGILMFCFVIALACAMHDITKEERKEAERNGKRN